jgi:hypothetical protein
MALELYAVAFTWTVPGFGPGDGLCNQTPVIVPFWLLYPNPEPLHTEALLLPEPLPLPDPLLLLPLPETVPLPPHPVKSKTWSANANEQRKQRKSRNMRYSFSHAQVRCSLPNLFCPK